MSINFIDLEAQRLKLGKSLENAVLDAIKNGHHILGPEVEALEKKLADYSKTPHVVTCANGTDALQLVLMALDIGPGDAVFVPSFTFIATAEVVALQRATPVFVYLDPRTFNMDPTRLQEAIDHVKKEGKLRPRAVIPVDLFGLACDYDALGKISAHNDLFLLGDGAQSFGARYKNAFASSIPDAWTTSFYPAKPLGCYGDGGAIFTCDSTLAQALLSFRYHGKGSHRYEHPRIGINSRLDTVQAAILLEKLKVYDEEFALRQKVATTYTNALQNLEGIQTPLIPEGYESIWAQYTLIVDNRDGVAQKLKSKGIPTMVYYPTPLPEQPAYHGYPCLHYETSAFLCKNVLSLPMHPYLSEENQEFIIRSVKEAL